MYSACTGDKGIINQLSYLMFNFGGDFSYENSKSKRLSKEYTGKVSHIALSNINLTITEREFVGIMGPLGRY